MLESVKNYIYFKSVDKLIAEKNYDLALDRLNFLINQGFMLNDTFLKRGQLCHKLLMTEEAYSDFTYIINHCSFKEKAYYERLQLNFEISNFYEAISDADKILNLDTNNIDVIRIKYLSLIYLNQNDTAKDYIMNIFKYDKYKILQFMFQEVAKAIVQDELSKGLKLLEIIDMIDKDNPIKLLEEANIYGLANCKEKQSEILKRIESVFPKYFISHFKFTDMFAEKNLLEIYFLLELSVFDKQNLFAYPMAILEGYKNHIEGHIINSKECFEKAISINPAKPEGYILLAQTFQLMSGYDNPEYKMDAEKNYQKALEIYEQENLPNKVEEMKRQLKHLNANLAYI